MNTVEECFNKLKESVTKLEEEITNIYQSNDDVAKKKRSLRFLHINQRRIFETFLRNMKDVAYSDFDNIKTKNEELFFIRIKKMNRIRELVASGKTADEAEDIFYAEQPKEVKILTPEEQVILEERKRLFGD